MVINWSITLFFQIFVHSSISTFYVTSPHPFIPKHLFSCFQYPLCLFEDISYVDFQILFQIRSVAQLCPTLCNPMNRQASLSITNSRSSLRLTSIESVMPSSHLILCRPLLLLPLIPPSITVFSSESTLHMRWPKYWSFSFSILV